VRETRFCSRTSGKICSRTTTNPSSRVGEMGLNRQFHLAAVDYYVEGIYPRPVATVTRGAYKNFGEKSIQEEAYLIHTHIPVYHEIFDTLTRTTQYRNQKIIRVYHFSRNYEYISEATGFFTTSKTLLKKYSLFVSKSCINSFENWKNSRYLYGKLRIVTTRCSMFDVHRWCYYGLVRE